MQTGGFILPIQLSFIRQPLYNILHLNAVIISDSEFIKCQNSLAVVILYSCKRCKFPVESFLSGHIGSYLNILKFSVSPTRAGAAGFISSHALAYRPPMGCYKILMGCDGKNLQETKDLYNLTDAEQELLESKRRGHALFIIGSKRLHTQR